MGSPPQLCHGLPAMGPGRADSASNRVTVDCGEASYFFETEEVILCAQWESVFCNFAIRCRCVRHVLFRYLFDLIIFLNAICLAFDFSDGEWWFLALFMLEIILKLYSFGARAFFRKLWNIFDVVNVGSAFIVSILELAFDGLKDSVISLDLLLGKIRYKSLKLE